MNFERLKLISLLFLLGSLLIISCEKEKIVSTVTTQPDPTLVGDECDKCHNGTFPQHSTNAHKKHTTGLYSYNCSTCHYGWETVNHRNTVKNVVFSPIGLATRSGADSNVPVYDPSTKKCSDVYCHSNGASAHRGNDGDYTWSSSVETVVYKTTPNWETGKITECTFCHNGKGNMTPPYLINKSDTSTQAKTQGNYPETGMHQLAMHTSNTQDFSKAPFTSPYWSGVQCFWCHNTQSGDSTIVNSSMLQGTYGTSYHLDGHTFFKPLNKNYGGTMANGLNYFESNISSHCSGDMKCW